MKSTLITLPALTAMLVAYPAFAHIDPVAQGSFGTGFTHPLFGLDHVSATVAVGLWAASLGGRALLALPAAFVGAMGLGFMMALLGVSLPLVEPLILGSVIVLGVALALALRPSLGAGVAVVGGLALFHGNAHGAEMGDASALAYLAGLIAMTGLLHALGASIGTGLLMLVRTRALRLAGGAIAALGAMLVLAS